ncbi:MAG: hypothetical protein RBS05_21305, partial [Zoogloea oleivorans]|uniref:hypothetical protein n=1 Tax=Zoogloea oleivorans TaxID=1552750 RepID=UPI002A365908
HFTTPSAFRFRQRCNEEAALYITIKLRQHHCENKLRRAAKTATAPTTAQLPPENCQSLLFQQSHLVRPSFTALTLIRILSS